MTPDGTVYLESNKSKWHVGRPYYFDNCGFSWFNVNQVTYEYANSLPNGPLIGGKWYQKGKSMKTWSNKQFNINKNSFN